MSTLLQMMMLLAREMRKIPRHRLLDFQGLQDLRHHRYRLHQQFHLGLQWLSRQCLRQLFHLSDLSRCQQVRLTMKCQSHRPQIQPLAVQHVQIATPELLTR